MSRKMNHERWGLPQRRSIKAEEDAEQRHNAPAGGVSRVITGACSAHRTTMNETPCVGWEARLRQFDNLYHTQRVEHPGEHMPCPFDTLCSNCRRLYFKEIARGRPR